jgi:activating signal cointegrator 1
VRALTISQPYASLIANGEKWVENRTWYTPYRGPLAIHAGKGSQYLDKQELAAYPTGCIIAVARLVACVRLPLSFPPDVAQLQRAGIDTNSFLRHEHTEGPCCWVLDDVRKLTKQIPYNGAQGIWLLPDSLFSPAAG